MKKLIAFILVHLLLTLNASAQYCGEGSLTFTVYTENGTTIDKFDYEIAPVSLKLLEEKYFKKVLHPSTFEESRKDLQIRIFKTGVIIPDYYANSIRDSISKESQNRLDELLIESDIQQNGAIKSTLTFKTYENLSFPILLKIHHDKNSIWV